MSDADIIRIFKVAPQLQKLRTLHNVEQFFHLLKRHGFTEVQIANIVRIRPNLVAFTERTIKPKIKVLEDFGVVDQNLVRLLGRSSSMLTLSLKNELLPKMEFLKNVFQSQDVLVKALLRAPRLVSLSLEKTLKPSLAFWKGWGFCGAELANFLLVNPVTLSRTSLMPAQVDLINKISPDKSSKMFKYTLGIVAASRTETLEAKIENIKLCGLSTEETWQLLRAVPVVLCFSKENVSEKLKFLVNNMELPANYVVKHPQLLQISLENTMRPRCLVWQKIKSINDPDIPLFTVLGMSEARFVSKIIKGHPESKTLLKVYENAISNVSNCTKSSTKT